MRLIIMLLSMFGAVTLSAALKTPFVWDRDVKGDLLTVTVTIPEHHYLYEHSTSVKVSGADGTEFKAVTATVTVEYNDDFSGKIRIYVAPQAVWTFKVNQQRPINISIMAQGCRKSDGVKPAICFMPENIKIDISDRQPPPLVPTSVTGADGDIKSWFSGFVMVRSAGGFMDNSDFLRFIQGETSGDLFQGRSLAMIIILILLGGIGLNLTPCVLPMIPINLAIIGAGKGAESRKAGFVRGGIYGSGMALAYGALGLITVLTGAQFGTLNSNAWFNFAIAAVFVLLALAMFGVFNLDFSRFGAKINTRNMERGRLTAVFLLGIVAALLAGACVAPVVLAVLIYSAKLYSEGNYPALLLPLLLGVGMALPWPLAGAGMAVLPRPGRWMVVVKYIFGLLIILFAAYYSYTGWRNLPLPSRQAAAKEEFSRFTAQLEQARKTGKPVVIDFWATWCKNCLEMNRTTFKDPQVIEALKPFEVIKYQAEDFTDPKTKALLEHFDAAGLPFFVILKPVQ